MLCSQFVLTKGIPFDLRLLSVKPLAVGVMTREQIDAELQKGVNSIKAGRVHSAAEVDAALAREFGIRQKAMQVAILRTHLMIYEESISNDGEERVSEKTASGIAGLAYSQMRKIFFIGNVWFDKKSFMSRTALYKFVIVSIAVSQNFIIFDRYRNSHVLKRKVYRFPKPILVYTLTVMNYKLA